MAESEDKVEGYDFQVEQLEAGGTRIADGYGNAWTIPAGKLDDLGDLVAVHPVQAIAQRFRERQPEMTVQVIRADEVELRRLDGWVPIRRSEVYALGEARSLAALDTEYGKPTADVIRYVDGVLMKMPTQLRQINLAKKNARAAMARQATEPTPEMLERAMRDGNVVKQRHGVVREHQNQDAGGNPVHLKEVRQVSQRLTGFTPVD